VEYSGGFGGKFGNLLITMAPYFLPTFSIMAVLFIPLVRPQNIFYYLVFIGFTLVFHIMNSVSGIWPFLKTVCLSSWDIYYDLIARMISVTLL